MADKKIVHNWDMVKPGDIISFRYKTKKTGLTKMHSLLVLNPRLPILGAKPEQSKFHLIGIKLEQSNVQQLRLTSREIFFLEQIGELKSIYDFPGAGQNLYKFNIDPKFILNEKRGVRKRAYDLISKSLNIQGQYRTYDYRRARRSAVYLEPIRVYREVKPDDDKL